MTRAQGCAPRSARSPTSPSTAPWWSRRSAARARRPPGSAAKCRRAARRQHPRRPRSGRPSTRPSPRCPTSACWWCSPSASSGCSTARPRPATSSPSPTCSPSSPSRSARSAGCSASSRAASSATGGSARCSTPPATMPYGDAAAAAPARGGARLEVARTSATPTTRRSRCCATSTSTSSPGRTVALVGATASGKSTLTTLLTRLVDPDDGRILRRRRRPPRPRATASCAEALAVVPQTAFLFDDTVRGNVTLGRRRHRRRGVGRAAHRPGRRLRRRAARRASTPGSASAAPRSPAASASASRLARALVRRPRLLILDDATSAVDPEVEARILAALRLRVTRRSPSSSWPTARPRSRWPTRWSTSTTGGSSTAARTPSCSRATRRTPAWSTPTSSAAASPRASGGGGDVSARPPADERRSGTRMDTGEDIGALDTIRRGMAFSPELREGIRVTLRPRRDRLVRPGRRADRGAADPRPRPQRPTAAPDVSFTVLMGLAAAAGDRGDQLRVLPDDQPAVHDLRARAGHAAHQGVPPRARPAAAHPEHRAPRRPGLPGHQRRRPGQPVPGLRRPDLRRQRRAGAGRDRA